jgi:ABC-2 type transport system permease protein
VSLSVDLRGRAREPRGGAPSLAVTLLANECRLGWRSIADLVARGKSHAGLRFAALIAALAALAFGFAALLVAEMPVLDHRDVEAAELVSVHVVLIVMLMISAALDSAAFALYARADYDLLFSAPVHPRLVFMVRAFNIALFTIAKVMIYGAPVLIMLAVSQGAHWLAGLPTLFGLALISTVASIAIAMGLVALIGVKRTRLAAQIVAALAGVGVFVMLQKDVLAPGSPAEYLQTMLSLVGGEEVDAPFYLPARALLGDVGAAAIVLLLSIGAFGAGVMALSGAFVRAAVASVGAAPAAPRRRRRGRASFGASVFATLMLKERRLILRDPWLLSQVLMQCLFLVPIALVLLGKALSGEADASLFTPLLIVLAGQIAGGLAWIALASEDAPDLVDTAPVAPSLLRRAKLAAVLWMSGLLAGAPLAILLMVAPSAGLFAVGGVLVAIVVAVAINFWQQPPLVRREALRSRRKGSTIVHLMEVMTLSLIAGAAWLAMQGLLLVALAPAGLAALAILVFYLTRRRAR